MSWKRCCSPERAIPDKAAILQGLLLLHTFKAGRLRSSNHSYTSAISLDVWSISPTDKNSGQYAELHIFSLLCYVCLSILIEVVRVHPHRFAKTNPKLVGLPTKRSLIQKNDTKCPLFGTSKWRSRYYYTSWKLSSRRIIWNQADQMEGSYCIATTPGVSECQQIQVSTPWREAEVT